MFLIVSFFCKPLHGTGQNGLLIERQFLNSYFIPEFRVNMSNPPGLYSSTPCCMIVLWTATGSCQCSRTLSHLLKHKCYIIFVKTKASVKNSPQSDEANSFIIIFVVYLTIIRREETKYYFHVRSFRVLLEMLVQTCIIQTNR